ncbi:MAG TPA: hypothetical protein VFG71_03455, partial [Nitrospiraceae bacterium]|nr:hypothetical protein [Nitrospiraceae bacterium]
TDRFICIDDFFAWFSWHKKSSFGAFTGCINGGSRCKARADVIRWDAMVVEMADHRTAVGDTARTSMVLGRV